MVKNSEINIITRKRKEPLIEENTEKNKIGIDKRNRHP